MRFLSCLAILALCGISAPALTIDEVVGTWKVDLDAAVKSMRNDPKNASLPPEQQQMSEAAVPLIFGAISVVITKDSLTTTNHQEQTVVTKIISLDSKSATKGELLVERNDGKKVKSCSIELKADGSLRIGLRKGETAEELPVPATAMPFIKSK